jgi:hypothetical protein
MARHQAGSAAMSTCGATRLLCGCSTRTPASCCASTFAPRAAGIVSKTPTAPCKPGGARWLRLARAATAGPSISAVCQAIHQQDGPSGIRRILGLSRGDVHRAVERIDEQGRVHEIGSREARLTAIANEYVRDPQAALVVSPDNQSRQDLNDVIHGTMYREGYVDRGEQRAVVLVPRQDITGANQQWAERYEEGDVVATAVAARSSGLKPATTRELSTSTARPIRVTVRTEREC